MTFREAVEWSWRGYPADHILGLWSRYLAAHGWEQTLKALAAAVPQEKP